MNCTDTPQLKTALEDVVTQNVLRLLSTALNSNVEAFQLDENLWPAVKKELKLQAVFPLVSVVKIDPKLPDREHMELLAETAKNIVRFNDMMQAQSDALALLNANDIHAAVIKGAAAAGYYEKPELRVYGDIDIIVLPDDYKKAFELLQGSGYQNLQEYDDSYERHVEFITPEGKEIELHRCFSSSRNERENDVFDGWLYEGIRNVEYINLDGYEVPVLPALENGLILLGHINQHLCEGLGLRQIIDWMLYVRTELTDAFWEERFRIRAEAIGMDCLAKTVTKMCKKHLGLNAGITWCEDADDELADELMLYIINNGNFGQKMSTESQKLTSIFRQLENPVKAFRYLTDKGSEHMIEAGLKPRKAYAWLYQIGHLLSKYVNSKNRGEIVKEVECSAKETDLLKKLHVTRI